MKDQATRGRTFRRLGLGTAAVLALGIAGCASTPASSQLVNARQAYNAAAQGPAAQVEPEHVLEAKNALKRAEAQHEEEPGSIAEKHLAYVAHRMAQVAMAKADATLARQEEVRAEQRYTEILAAQKLQAERRLEQQEKSLGEQERQLAAAHQARMDAEQRLANAEQRLRAAIESLQRIAVIEVEPRGVVITLNGAVLFAFGESELLPIAKEKLREVAKALTEEIERGKILLVEGHTDAVGSDAANMKLSQDRADSVRQFLVDEGIDPAKVKAVGRGESQPLVANDTPTNRANNRRVEIVVRDAEAGFTSEGRSQGEERSQREGRVQ